jgi:FtsH-binding integral membrane protein
MRQWWRRLRGALGMGLLWAAGGALVGGLIEAVLNVLPGSDLFLGVDIWPAALAIPAFLAGVVFSLVLSLAERRRSFDELTLPRFALWGGIVGLLLGVVIGFPLVAIASITLVCSASAAGSLALARRAKQRDLIAEGTDPS